MSCLARAAAAKALALAASCCLLEDVSATAALDVATGTALVGFFGRSSCLSLSCAPFFGTSIGLPRTALFSVALVALAVGTAARSSSAGLLFAGSVALGSGVAAVALLSRLVLAVVSATPRVVGAGVPGPPPALRGSVLAVCADGVRVAAVTCTFDGLFTGVELVTGEVAFAGRSLFAVGVGETVGLGGVRGGAAVEGSA